MQNRYAGDIGDYGKFGLLRWMYGRHDGDRILATTVLWYLTPDESHNQDGKHINYLEGQEHAAFQDADPALFQAMQDVVNDPGGRRVATYPGTGLMPPGTRWHDTPLDFVPRRPAHNEAHRRQWFETALQCCAGAELVICDPDNGMQIKSTNPFRSKRGNKYVAIEELRQVGQLHPRPTIIVYQHRSRTQIVAQVDNGLRMLRQAGLTDVVTVLFRRYQSRLYHIALAGRDAGLVRDRIQAMCDSRFGKALRASVVSGM